MHEAALEITEACVRLGGTITGEHGVGMEKMEAMRLIFSDEDLDFQRRVKDAFDPAHRFNPGKVLPPALATEPPPVASAAATAGEWTPADADEACAFVRQAIAGRQTLLPAGCGSLLDFGNLPAQPEIRLRSQKLAAVVDYDPPNQVAVLGAGMTWLDAQALLAQNRQWIPIRPPLSNASTLGGVVALGSCGPERAYYGAPRDRLLGLKFVSGLGRHIAVGGRVMKNVAGYDITRLLTGSAGTLGFLTQLNFRVASAPETCRAVHATGSLAQCAAAAAALLDSNVEPAFVTAERNPAGTKWAFLAGFEGFNDTVRAQTVRCLEILQKAGLGVQGEQDYPLLAGSHAETFARICGASFSLCACLPVDDVARFAGIGQSSLADPCVLADFAGGRVSLGVPALTEEQWGALVAAAKASGGSVVLAKARPEFKRRCDVFGPPRPEWTLSHRLKSALDPHGVFAPGRLPGRLPDRI